MPAFPRKPAPIPTETRPPPTNPYTPPPSYDAPQTSGLIGTNVPPSDFQPAGYLPPPPGWNGGGPPPSYAYPHPPQQHQHHRLQQQQQQQQPPIVVNQHYYLVPSAQLKDGMQDPQQPNGCALTKMVLGSAINLTNQVMPGVLPALLEEGQQGRNGTHLLNQSAAAVDQICDRFNDIMTLIDRERYCGNEKELFICQPSSNASSSDMGSRGQPASKPKKKKDRDHPKGQTTAVAATVISGNYFAKVELYANSRLPMNLPPLKLYIPTWPLLCLAAQYSERVYDKPRGKERDVQVDADQRTGAKAMVIKSVPMDHMNTIVFAIRGTSTFMDWAVNLNTAPTSPIGFLVSCHQASAGKKKEKKRN